MYMYLPISLLLYLLYTFSGQHHRYMGNNSYKNKNYRLIVPFTGLLPPCERRNNREVMLLLLSRPFDCSLLFFRAESSLLLPPPIGLPLAAVFSLRARVAAAAASSSWLNIAWSSLATCSSVFVPSIFAVLAFVVPLTLNPMFVTHAAGQYAVTTLVMHSLSAACGTWIFC